MKVIKFVVLHLGLLHPQSDSCDSALDFGLNGSLKTQRDFAAFCLEQPSCRVDAYKNAPLNRQLTRGLSEGDGLVVYLRSSFVVM